MAESKERFSTLSPETLEAADIGEAAQPHLSEGATPAAHIAKLAEVDLFMDAVKYLAHSLDVHSSIAWSLACAQQLEAETTPAERDAFLAIDTWLAEPTDANRRACESAAEKAQISSPAGCIAMAVFFAEGSIAPPDLSPVAVPPHLAQKIAAAAVTLAVVKEPKEAPSRYRRCLQLGLQPAPK